MASVSTEKALPRPAPVTVSAGLIMLGSFLVVVLAFSGISELRSIATREVVEKGLKDWPLSAMNLSLDEALNLIQTTSMVAGACAAAMTVLGFYVFQRSRGARAALSVLAVPLLATGLFVGGFMVTLVALATGTLWLQPARNWFNGVAPPSKRDAESVVPAGSAASAAGWPPPLAASLPNDPVAPPSSTPTADRPKAVTVACIAAWAGSAVTALFTAVSLVVLKASPDQVIRELEQQQPELAARGIDGETVISASFIIGGLVILWCIGSLIVTTLAFRRVGWARIVLLVSGGGATILTVFGAIGAVVMLPLLMACVLSISLMMRPEVRVWYAVTP